MGGSNNTAPPNQNVNTSSSFLSNIVQVDGMDTVDVTSSSKDDSSDADISNVTDYASQDEIDPDTTPIKFPPAENMNHRKKKIVKASSLPLVAVLNARSAYNKSENLKNFLNELGIEVAMILETWEREELSLENLLQLPIYKLLCICLQKKHTFEWYK